MEEQLISFYTAMLAKEKGFNPYNISGYHYSKVDGKIYHSGMNLKNDPQASTQSLLQKWLRDEHKIHIEIVYWENNTWSAQLVGDKFQGESGDDYEAFDCNTYEKALELGLQEALKLI
jgi:hypothetical protein